MKSPSGCPTAWAYRQTKYNRRSLGDALGCPSIRQSGILREPKALKVESWLWSLATRTSLREVIVPSHGLDREFDSIVSSSDFGVELPSQQPLWDAAFDALGPEFGYANSLLVEDTLREVELFRDLGGAAYQYRNGQEFDDWLNS